MYCTQQRYKLEMMMNADINKVDANLLGVDQHMLSPMVDHDIHQLRMPMLNDPVVIIDGISD